MASDTESMKIYLQGTNQADFINFLYEYSSSNRLNVQWFGWHAGTEPVKWFERSDRAAKFKIGMFLLTEDNGHLFFSNRFDDESRVNFNIDYGSKKQVWLDVVKDFKDELEVRGWTVEQ